jgi:3-oxoacyl-[acyl-carrier-protein] synthase II
LIRDGVCDVVVCGSSDASLQPSLLGSYRRLGVLARHGDPRTACKPFDQERDGFLVGEGAAVMVLESRSHAERRGASPLAQFVAGRTFSDGSGVAGLDESADGLARAITGVAVAGGLSAGEIDLVNFHGTGTEQNDRTEVRAWTKALAGRSMQGIACAFKGALGHLMGAAGSVETALTILALRDQLAPPTANLQCVADDLQSHGPVRFTGRTATPMKFNTVLKTSLGFGGPVAAVLLKRAKLDAAGQ